MLALQAAAQLLGVGRLDLQPVARRGELLAHAVHLRDEPAQVAVLRAQPGLGAVEPLGGKAEPARQGERLAAARRAGDAGGRWAGRSAGSNSMAAQVAPGSSRAAAASWVRWVVITPRLPVSSSPSRSATARAAPSSGSVPEPSSSRRTRLSGPAASQASLRRSSRPLNVERSASRSCSSPTVATRRARNGTRLPGRGGDRQAALGGQGEKPLVLRPPSCRRRWAR